MSAFRFSGFILVFFISSMGFAEYRVFRLKITRTPASASTASPDSTTPVAATPTSPPGTSNQQSPQVEESRLVESTLDPIQYPGYYALQADEKVEMITTWRCFGRTAEFKSFCPNPKEQNLTLQKPSESPGTAP